MSYPSNMYVGRPLFLIPVKLSISHMYSRTSLLRTFWDLKFSPYYRGFLNSEVMSYTTVLHWDTEWCPYYRGFHISEVVCYFSFLVIPVL